VIQQSVDRCPCCDYRTGCTTCPVCFWTDDGQRHTDDGQRHNGDGPGDADAGIVAGGPNGEISLSDARLNFSIYGASHRRYRDVVRPPRSDELA
jgi:hypothetical protein